MDMKFSKEYLENPLFRNVPMSYDEFLPERVRTDSGEEQEIQTGCRINEDGSVSFHLYAPGTHQLTLKIVINRVKNYEYELEKNGEYFDLEIENDGRFNGPLNLLFFFDGAHLLYPRLPIYWSMGAACNYIEFPSHKLDFCLVKDVPHGTISENIYYSSTLSRWERCFVYTPPGYEKSSQDYPVLYLQHGGGENETVWESTGKLSAIMDNAIAEKRCVPFIVVMNNGMIRYPGNSLMLRDEAFEDNLISSCIPFIEGKYRVLTDRFSRAIAGLSMGAFLTNDIALNHPELFAYLGAFTGSMYHGGDVQSTYPCPWPRVMQEEQGKVVKESFRVYYQSATTIEDFINYVRVDNQICVENGVAEMGGYRFVVHEENETKWTSWRMGLNEFISLLFRRAEAYQSKETLNDAIAKCEI